MIHRTRLAFAVLALCAFLAPLFILRAKAEPHYRDGTKISAATDRCRVYRERFTWRPPVFELPPGDSSAGAPAAAKPKGPMPGHSPRGEGFDGGPRSLAGKRAGLPKLSFPISTASSEAQDFFNQGVAQLHGYQFLEAERSFRKVLALDPNATMAYWGMALASINGMTLYPNARSLKLIAQAAAEAQKPEAQKKLSPREKNWIAALEKAASPPEKAVTGYLAAMKKMAESYPDDVEVLAFYAHAMVLGTPDAKTAPIESAKQAAEADAVLDKVFKLSPRHPAHHYRIHLWDGRDDMKSAASALEVGPSAPGIAHMWHMPTHHYSRLKKDRQASWHEEAAIRADHAYMKEAGVMPNEIHNYTHNAELYLNRLWKLGRPHHALEATLNFMQTPNDTNAPGNMGSSPVEQVTESLIADLDAAEMWDKLIGLRNSPVFSLPLNPEDEVTKVIHLARAAAGAGNKSLFAEQISAIKCLSGLVQEKSYKAGKIPIQIAEAEIELLRVWMRGDQPLMKESFAGLVKASEYEEDGKKRNWLAGLRGARYALVAGEAKTALEWIEPLATKQLNDFNVQTTYAEALHANGKKDDARDVLAKISSRFGPPDPLDRELGPQKRRAELVALVGDSMPMKPLWKDERHPALSTLGPLGWTPPVAPRFVAQSPDGKPFVLPPKKPVAVIFNLGKGCVHCNEQIRALAEKAGALKKTGLEVVVVTNEPVATLRDSIAEYKKIGVDISFSMVSDASLETFKRFGVYDETDRSALHGLFLIDAEGKVRWRDIGANPYLSFPYFVEESARLLEKASNFKR